MYYTIYKTTNLLNGKYYIGAHQTKNLDDGYMGSGVALKKAIEKYGKKSFNTEILHIVDSKEKMYELEKELVSINENTYNLTAGGEGGWSHVDLTGDNNPMKDPAVVNKVITSAKKTREKNKEFYDQVSTNNLKPTWEANRGKKRPEHAELMKAKSAFNDPEVRAANLAKRKAKAKRYTIQSPCGIIYKSKTAMEMHNEIGIPCSTLTTKAEGTKLKRGAFKNWTILRINYES